jgi:hypothetical protein
MRYKLIVVDELGNIIVERFPSETADYTQYFNLVEPINGCLTIAVIDPDHADPNIWNDTLDHEIEVQAYYGDNDWGEITERSITPINDDVSVIVISKEGI